MTRRKYTPRPYQAHMIDHAINVPRCALWATMGMGKGVAALTALHALYAAGIESSPTLVLGPLRVARDVWPNECAKWDHLSGLEVTPIIGSLAQRNAAVHRDSPIYSINYDNLEWLVEHWGDRWPYGIVVPDESTRLKGYRGSMQLSKKGKEFIRQAGGKRARALGKVAHTKVKRFIHLTGTPSPNGLADLWGQTWFLDAGRRLGRTYEAFTRRWFQKGHDGFALAPLPFAQEQIQDAVRDLCLTIDAKDYFDLKDPIVNIVRVDLPPAARARYREMEKDMFTVIASKEVEAFGAAARTQKCLQLANGAAYINQEVTDDGHKLAREWREVHDAKLQALDSIVSEANGAPMIVSYEFKSDLARILKAFPNAVDISTPEGEKAFRTGRASLGCAHPASMGHGVEGLQDVCNIITFFGNNWNLELHDQIIGRIGPVRQMQSGLDRPVFVNYIVARRTVEELVIARRDSKRSVQDLLLEAMKRGYPE